PVDCTTALLIVLLESALSAATSIFTPVSNTSHSVSARWNTAAAVCVANGNRRRRLSPWRCSVTATGRDGFGLSTMSLASGAAATGGTAGVATGAVAGAAAGASAFSFIGGGATGASTFSMPAGGGAWARSLAGSGGCAAGGSGVDWSALLSAFAAIGASGFLS